MQNLKSQFEATAHTFDDSLDEKRRLWEERYNSMTEAVRAEESLRDDVQSYNERPGDLSYIDCLKCRNKGVYAEARDGALVLFNCDCLPKRATMHRVHASGLGDMVRRYTFEAYKDGEYWQAQIKSRARKFLQQGFGWFYIGGQPGSGKTHICTAITAELIGRGLNARYMLWRDEGLKLTASVNDSAEYKRIMEPLKRAKVLYIDDFLKPAKGNAPTTGEIKIAYELLNFRYNDTSLITIISSEHLGSDIESIDEALWSRIYERTGKKKYCLQIDRDHNKNLRLRD